MSIWNSAVSGRMKTDFQISVEITYNNFPLPKLTPQQKMEIIALSEKVLETRQAFSTSTIAELYGDVSMPKVLQTAHQELDRYMLSLYGLKVNATETQILKALFETYALMTNDKLI